MILPFERSYGDSSNVTLSPGQDLDKVHSQLSADVSQYLNLCGHGIGTALHEAPEIPNYEVGRKGVRLRPGMTLAIEPMINIGTHEVDWLDDDWTVVTRDGSLSAHYENTILITEGEPRILSLTCENE